jgi:hypothetical protein
MPSFQHDTLVELFKNRPELAPLLLTQVLGVKLPPYRQAQPSSVDLGDIEPAERYADSVVLLYDKARRRRRPILGLVVEVQLSRKERKRFTWPAYLTRLRADHECEVMLLVLAPDAKVAAWARQPIQLGYGSVVQPLVIGPKSIPVVRNLAQALVAPELGVLSAMAHGHGEVKTAVRIAVITLRAAERRAAKHFEMYYDWIVAALSPAARKAFEMLPEGYQFRDRSLRRSFQKGRAEGRAEGEVVRMAKDVLAVLEERRLSVTREQRERILSTTDADTLDSWIRKAVTVTRTDELFSRRARPKAGPRRPTRRGAERQ